MKTLLQIINEEIKSVFEEYDLALQEQAATQPAAPAQPATPPAQPDDKEYNDLKDKIKKTSKEDEIKKILQNAIVGKQEQQKIKNFYDKLIADTELKDNKTKIQNFFNEFYPNINKKKSASSGGKPNSTPPVAVNATPAPAQQTQTIVKESKLQKSVREYLHYKRLYNRSGV
jgi:hypothetical protein